MTMYEVRAMVSGQQVPAFFVYALDRDDARQEALKILLAMTGSRSAEGLFDRIAGYSIQIEEA